MNNNNRIAALLETYCSRPVAGSVCVCVCVWGGGVIDFTLQVFALGSSLISV